MHRIATLALALSMVAVAAIPGNAATKGKWQAWRGSKGPMLFQVGPTHTARNCFGNCNSVAMRKGTQHHTSYARTYTTGTQYSDDDGTYFGNEYPVYGYPYYNGLGGIGGFGGFGGSGFVTPGGVHMGNFSGSGGISGGAGVSTGTGVAH
jgi:hypothetical protein